MFARRCPFLKGAPGSFLPATGSHGMERPSLAMAEYALMFLVGLSVLLMLDLTVAWQIVSMALWVIVYLVLMIRIDWRCNRSAVQEKL